MRPTRSVWESWLEPSSWEGSPCQPTLLTSPFPLSLEESEQAGGSWESAVLIARDIVYKNRLTFSGREGPERWLSGSLEISPSSWLGRFGLLESCPCGQMGTWQRHLLCLSVLALGRAGLWLCGQASLRCSSL